MQTTPGGERAPLSIHAGYYDLLVWAGLEVLGSARFGTPRGDYVFAVKNSTDHGDAYGICIVGYGSCEGCDVLRSVRPKWGATEWTTEDLLFAEIFASETANATHWGTRSELAEKFADQHQILLQWWGHEPGYTEAITELLKLIPE